MLLFHFMFWIHGYLWKDDEIGTWCVCVCSVYVCSVCVCVECMCVVCVCVCVFAVCMCGFFVFGVCVHV